MQVFEKLALTNYTHIFGLTGNSDSGSYIIITGSTFVQMNIFTNVTALATYNAGVTPNKTLSLTGQLEQLTYKALLHKGIILNLEDFGGHIEVADS